MTGNYKHINYQGGIYLLQTKDIETVEEELHGFPVITVNIRTKKAAKQLKRTAGRYITIETKTVCAGS